MENFGDYLKELIEPFENSYTDDRKEIKVASNKLNEVVGIFGSIVGQFDKQMNYFITFTTYIE